MSFALPHALPGDFEAAQRVLVPPAMNRRRPLDLTISRTACRQLAVDPAAPGYGRVAVVGSKGKGTATLACSATLTQSGLRVGTVTSPSFLCQTERIRVQGTSITQTEYIAAARSVRAAVQPLLDSDGDALPPHLGGMHFLAALNVFQGAHLDVAVFEASMGGAQDEVSLLDPSILVVAEIFEEHLGKLGNNRYEIAVEKLRAAGPSTRVVVTVEQSADVWQAMRDLGLLERCEVIVVDADAIGHHPNPVISRNVELGHAAARAFCRLHALPEPAFDSPVVRLPGRCSRVNDDCMVDGARTPAGVLAALDAYRSTYGRDPAVVYACFNAGPSAAAAVQVIRDAGIRVVGAYMPQTRDDRRADPAIFAPEPVVDATTIDFTTRGWLALGIGYFLPLAMSGAGLDLSRLW